jgi:hypothetical protein
MWRQNIFHYGLNKANICTKKCTSVLCLQRSTWKKYKLHMLYVRGEIVCKLLQVRKSQKILDSQIPNPQSATFAEGPQICGICDLQNLFADRPPLFRLEIRFRGQNTCIQLDIWQETHCEKSLFVLASRQKIQLFRTENPAVDYKINLPANHWVFTIRHGRKVTVGKSWPVTTDTARKSRQVTKVQKRL